MKFQQQIKLSNLTNYLTLLKCMQFIKTKIATNFKKKRKKQKMLYNQHLKNLNKIHKN